uniref:F-box domain-containing protein n=1 Tax=Meloidogyne enterolobii TaxID=390850 RepID=A0A6V7WV82_MELEN|nr:unnamed protein product [Meloidogyne enterolobii]
MMEKIFIFIIKMHSLPIEVQLRILKCLNFNELISVKQTNFYFHNLINKYEGELARKKFSEISIININALYCSVKTIELQSEVAEFTLNDQLKKRWQEAIENSVPLFINYVESGVKYVCIKDYKKTYFLKF